MSQPRVILFCSSLLALPALQELVFFNQLAVVIIPSNCEDMIGHARSVLQNTEIPVVLVKKKTYEEQVTVAIEQYQANTGLLITFPYLIPEKIYSKPVHGFYNVHPGPLPAYRGADPVFQQIKNREKKATVTIHLLIEEPDAGPVVMQEMIVLNPADTYGMLTSKLGIAAAKLIRALLKLIDFDLSVPSRPQDESKARFFKKQNADEIVINWETMAAGDIVALIHACNPWNKGAVTKLNHKIIRLLEAELTGTTQSPDETAGTIISIGKEGLLVVAADKQLICIRVIYTDEGYLLASRLDELGLQKGQCFQSV
jgi:methionyl-tRNA formyltransferase